MPAGIPAPLSPLLGDIGPRAGLLLAHNGGITRTELQPDLVAGGVVLGGVAEETAQRVGAIARATDSLVELGTAFMKDPVLIDVPPGSTIDEPLVVLNWVDADGGAVFPRTVVRLGEGARACVVEVVASAGGSSLVVPTAELEVEDSAELSYLALQEEGPCTWSIAYQASEVGSGAALQSLTVALGGEYARVRTDSRLVGRGGSTSLLAAYFGTGQQMHDFRTLQDHDAAKTTSDLLFKGAVKDAARSVYSGLIRVRKGAAGSDAFQTNRNLVLSEGAHADSVPNLDIEENDVRCSHASAVGPIDEDQRYYLETRGVLAEAADRLVVLGFFEELLSRSGLPGLSRHVRAEIASKLDARSATELAEALSDR